MIYICIRKKVVVSLGNPLTSKSSKDYVLTVTTSGSAGPESGNVSVCLDVVDVGNTDTVSAVPIVQVEAEVFNNVLNAVSGISY